MKSKVQKSENIEVGLNKDSLHFATNSGLSTLQKTVSIFHNTIQSIYKTPYLVNCDRRTESWSLNVLANYTQVQNSLQMNNGI